LIFLGARRRLRRRTRRACGEDEAGSDLDIRVAADQPEHLELAIRQLVELLLWRGVSANLSISRRLTKGAKRDWPPATTRIVATGCCSCASLRRKPPESARRFAPRSPRSTAPAPRYRPHGHRPRLHVPHAPSEASLPWRCSSWSRVSTISPCQTATGSSSSSADEFARMRFPDGNRLVANSKTKGRTTRHKRSRTPSLRVMGPCRVESSPGTSRPSFRRIFPTGRDS
jgi:hypothetical protein